MYWCELYGKDNQPTNENIAGFIDSDLWLDFNSYLQQTYSTQPNISYSDCSMDKGFWKGWNVKYKKSGKALCTLYPKLGYFISMVVVGSKEVPEADFMIPTFSEYMRNLYNDTKFHMGGKWLSVDVTDSDILSDVNSLVALRVKPKHKKVQT